MCKNWDDLIFDDNLEIDMEAVEDTESMLCFVLMTSTLQKVARHLLCLVKLQFRDHLVCRQMRLHAVKEHIWDKLSFFLHPVFDKSMFFTSP